MSPIERRMFDALRDHVPHGCGLYLLKRRAIISFDAPGVAELYSDWEWELIGGVDPGYGINLVRDIRVASYKLDVAIGFTYGHGVLAIECDGHAFHERTKQQAAYDRSRDRELLRLGINTARFTGSEIVHSSERCAREAFAILDAMVPVDHRSVVGRRAS